MLDELWTVELYSGLRASEDTGDPAGIAMLERGEGLIARTIGGALVP